MNPNKDNLIWKDVHGYEGLYKVSSAGDIKSLPKLNGRRMSDERILKQSVRKDGYAVVNLYKNNKAKVTTVHRIVALAFLENADYKSEVDHIDGDPLNNSVGNLRWATTSENHLNPVTIKRRSGKNHPFARRVRCVETGDTFDSLRQASEWLGLSKGSLARSFCKGQKCGGYHWEYVS